MHLVNTEAPAIEPLSLSEVKLHCYIDGTTFDSMLNVLIQTARIWVEQYCINSIITQSWRVTYDYHDATEGFWMGKRKFLLPQQPVQSIATVTTYDSENSPTVFDASNYRLSGDRLVLNDNFYWPSNLRLFDALQVDFVAGFGSQASDVPPNITLAMKMLIACWFENRESITDDMLATNSIPAIQLPYGVSALLATYRRPVL